MWSMIGTFFEHCDIHSIIDTFLSIIGAPLAPSPLLTF